MLSIYSADFLILLFILYFPFLFDFFFFTVTIEFVLPLLLLLFYIQNGSEEKKIKAWIKMTQLN